MPDYEYRVLWTREGRPRRTAILQTEQGAKIKAQRVRALDDALYHDGDGDGLLSDELIESFASADVPLPPLTDGPHVERREVGAWTRA